MGCMSSAEKTGFFSGGVLTLKGKRPPTYILTEWNAPFILLLHPFIAMSDKKKMLSDKSVFMPSASASVGRKMPS